MYRYSNIYINTLKVYIRCVGSFGSARSSCNVVLTLHLTEIPGVLKNVLATAGKVKTHGGDCQR